MDIHYDCRQILDCYGERKQLDMAVEECSELIQSIQKNKRGHDNRNNIVEEIADVEIMIEQLKMIFDINPQEVLKIKQAKCKKAMHNWKESIVNELKSMAADGIQNFSPLDICEKLELNNVRNIMWFLLSLTKLLEPCYIVECPDGHIDFITNDINLISANTRVCHICGKKYNPTPDKTIIEFKFTEDFKESLKNKSI